MPDDERVLGGGVEEGGVAEDRDEHGVADDRGEDGGDEGVGLEIVAVQELDGQERGAEGGAEDGRGSGGDAGDEQDAALALADVQVPPDGGPDGAADLHHRALASAGPPERQREDGREGLDRDHAAPHLGHLLVEGANGRVGPGAHALGGEPVDDQAGEEGADGREDPEQPRTWRVRFDPAEFLELTGGAQALVAGEVVDDEGLHHLEQVVQDAGHEAGRGADDDGVDEDATDDAEIERRGLAEDGREQTPTLMGRALA